MTLLWRFECDGDGCKANEAVAPMVHSPPGWLMRTIIDRIESLDDPATGTGLGAGRSELQRQKHYCPGCRRKASSRL